MASRNKEGKKPNSSTSKARGDSPNFSKRKKDLENAKGGNSCVSKHVIYDWSQTDETVTINLVLDSTTDELKEGDVRITDCTVHVQLPDGRDWGCQFVDEVEGKESQVILQKGKLVIWMLKKKAKSWSKHHIMDMPPSPTVVTPEPAVTEVTEVTEVSPMEEDEPEVDENPCPTTEDSSEHQEKEEEPVYHLQHTKNDWIEKADLFTVHIYVKQAPKDTVNIIYEKNAVTVKFQTGDAKFLALHANTGEETVFCWKITLKHEIIPADCRHKVTPSLIDITLRKSDNFRWGGLEAPQNKAPASMVSKSDSWIPLNKSTNHDSGGVKTSQSSVAFDELSNVKVAGEDPEPLDIDEVKASYDSTSLDSMANKENLNQKPTCKVSPLNKPARSVETIVSPGHTGLENLGNTCFMNSVLQALANTREFRDYFLDARFQKEINTDNILGSGGKLAVGFAVLMKVLWAGTHYSYAPSKLKNLIALKASQFTGYAQHDAQEFMAFLLDGLHEDLNRIRKKPYTETIDSDGRPDEVVADEAWLMYKKRNDSFVVDLFQGQYKSKLVCPECGKVSITFDPFLYLSVPLPKKKRLLQVTFMSRDPHRKPLKMLLRLSRDATLDQLKEQVYRKTGVRTCDMKLFEAYKGKIHKFFSRSSDLSGVQNTDNVIVAEVLSEEMAGEPVYEVAVIQRTVMPNQLPTKCAHCKKICAEGSKLKRCTKCYKVGYCDQTCQKLHWPLHKSHCKSTPDPVGTPFILSIPESRATFSRLCKLMEAYARYSVDVFQPPVKAESPTKLSSHLSSSDLSSSSQSSGSLSSLDSQSSLSSTCTLTADNDTAAIAELEPSTHPAEACGSAESMVTHTGGLTSRNSSKSLPEFIDSTGYESATSTAFGSEVNSENCELAAPVTFTQEGHGQGDELESEPKAGSSQAFFTPPCSKDKTPTKSVPTNAVMGMQLDEGERAVPPFHIKPVNQFGEGLTGPDGERLDDKGDIPLDLSNKPFLSIDWKNNERGAERRTPYVLVQTKQLEVEEDESVQSTSLEESGNITLDQCLGLFTEPEVLSPDEAWYCPQCKAHREATKQMSIWRLPHTLIIQLKRFSFRNFIWRDKIDKVVEFPTRGLDLSKYYHNAGTRPSSEPRPVYDLYAVVNHLGGILGGHYTSYVRCADLLDPTKSEVDWRLCDDSRVTMCSDKSAVTRAAYVLFYRRRNMFVSLPPVVTALDDEEELSEEMEQTNDDNHISKRDNSPLSSAQKREAVACASVSGSKQDELPELICEGPSEGLLQGETTKDNRYAESPGFTDMDMVD